MSDENEPLAISPKDVITDCIHSDPVAVLDEDFNEANGIHNPKNPRVISPNCLFMRNLHLVKGSEKFQTFSSERLFLRDVPLQSISLWKLPCRLSRDRAFLRALLSLIFIPV